MADQNPIPDQQDRNVEEPGDTNSADIVGRTGEQMPKQSHDGVESVAREDRTRGVDEDKTPAQDDRSATPRTSNAPDF
ncbi:MAG TPA: hypothetical protein VNT81_07250 [Vicinamibacterales bacterium]|nr:hypothetical protein [Vicinamibacterales bacterium]